MDLLKSLPERGLAIVGTREPRGAIRQWLKSTVMDLEGEDLVIVSGFARGVDEMAHSAAMDAGLPTIAVLGTALDVDYPPEHQQLRQKILARDGLLVSEYCSGETTYPSHFIRRNRLIAGWSAATWIVQAPSRSGALNTAEWARQMDRVCFATPCFPGDPAFLGNQTLLDRDHAQAVWGSHSFGQVWLELSARGQRHPGKKLANLTPEAKEIASQLGQSFKNLGGRTVEELLDWALEQKWVPGKFYASLQELIAAGVVLEQNGLILKNPGDCV
jgi:DNA processing protein